MGTVTYNKILDGRSLYDSNEYPYASTVTFETPLTSASIKLISFMNMCRLDNDNVQLTHYEIDTEISLNIRAVNA